MTAADTGSGENGSRAEEGDRPAGDRSRSIVRFRDVSLRYDRGDPVLSKVDLDIDPGSFQFLTGPSGAGKTSLMRLMFLSLRPSSGRLSVFGHDAGRAPRRVLPQVRRRIGIVFQDFRLLDHMSLYENVALPLRVRGYDEVGYRRDVVDLLGWVGLKERIDDLPPVLSGGEKQRVAIARALIDQPELLLADEPTGNLDPSLAQRLMRLFVELNRSGTSVVIATHDLGLMDRFQARRLVLEDGAVTVYG